MIPFCVCVSLFREEEEQEQEQALVCVLSLVMHAKMLQSSLILYARNEKPFYDRIMLVRTYISVVIS